MIAISINGLEIIEVNFKIYTIQNLMVKWYVMSMVVDILIV